MENIVVSIKDKLAIVTLNNGKANALNKKLITKLSNMLTHIENDEQIGGVILTGREGFFSAGLDLVELYHLDQAGAKSFWQLFLDFTAKLIAFKKPMVAAINGHSPAGGCVMALACDARIMAEGKYIIGLNEVPVGIIVPNSIFRLYAFWLGQANAARSLLEGKLFTPQEAYQIGLVDELAKPESILTAAEKRIRKYMALAPNTWQQSKINIRKQLIAASQENHNQELEEMLQQWFSPATRAILKNILQNLGK